MSLTLPAAYSSASKVGNIQENWIVQLYYDNEGANDWVGISMADTTVGSVFYHGVITNTPSIRSSIDLVKSTAKTGNISLSVVNFQYKGDDFSAELFLGTRKYINRNVKIYSQLNGDSTLANCLQVYQGRLIDISHDDASIKLTLTEQRPWDFISIPQTKTTDTKVYAPVSYGDFVKNTNSSYSSPEWVNDLSSLAYRPAPLNNTKSDFNFYLTSDSDSSDTNHEPAYYDDALHKFLPIKDGTSADVLDDGVYNTKGDDQVKRGFKQTAVSNQEYSNSFPSVLTENPDANGSTVDKIFDRNDSTYWHIQYKKTSGSDSSSLGVTIDFEKPAGDFSQGVLKMTYEVDWVTGSHVSHYISIRQKYGGGTYGYTTHRANSGDYAKTTVSTACSSLGGSMEISILFEKHSSQAIEGHLKIYDVSVELESQERDDQHKFAYVGADGLTNSWDSSAISYGHEAHRDLLIRYTGYTTTAPENWSALNTDRAIATWKIRWWALEPVELKKLLEQMQYEFGFIFKFRPDGTGSYIHVLQTSELSAAQTFSYSDITNLQINNTPFSELLTKMEINYEKHPAENRHLSSVTASNSTARTSWNIQTKENISEVNLDMNVGTPNSSGQTDGNADFYSYYDNLFGDIKKVISCDIVNPAVSYDLETGDIIQFSNTKGEMPIEPFGDNWADYYMITALNRSPGKISITAREVG